MPSRRFYIATAPIGHINGKMAPVATICSNSDDPEHEPAVSFWYGYRHRATPNVSRFGIRSVRRDLATHPYTAAEDENRTLFRASLQAVYEHKKITTDWGKMLADFSAQDKYTTPIGYAVAACRANGGEWLDDWTA